MKKILVRIGVFFRLTRQEKTVAIFLLISLLAGNGVLLVKRRRAGFAPDLIASPQPTLEQLSLKGDSLATTGTEYLRLNINVASLEELQLLPGIGPATAEKILHYRDSVGTFKTPEEIMGVKGIGEAKYRRLKDCISTQPPKMK